jgi:hypothetical protein
MGTLSPHTKFKRPDDPRGDRGLGTPTFQEDRMDQTYRARISYVKNTGKNDLKDIRTTGAWKKFSAEEKKEYAKRYADDVPEDKTTLSKKTLLGS